MILVQYVKGLTVVASALVPKYLQTKENTLRHHIIFQMIQCIHVGYFFANLIFLIPRMDFFCISLFVVFLLAIVLSVFPFTDSDYTFRIFQIFLTLLSKTTFVSPSSHIYQQYIYVFNNKKCLR
jgi:hypothetical protein